MKNRPINVFVKIILAIVPLVLFGLPILETWKMLILLSSWLALICCEVRWGKWRIVAVVAVVLLVPYAKSFLPRAGIEEGHNIFLYQKPGEAIQQALPLDIFTEWKQSFDGVYPPQNEPYESNSWRAAGVVPGEAFAFSSDSLWRPAFYSRQVDSISFKSLGEFRGGFANNLHYNWWEGDLDRREMPFFVMYEFSEQSVGSVMRWQGIMFWEKPDGAFEKIIHETEAAKVITGPNVGRKAYMLFLPKLSPKLFVHLEHSPRLKAGLVAMNTISIIGIFILFGLMTSIKWRSFLIAISLTLASVLIIYVSISLSGGQSLGASYPPHRGGDDGLLHESHGRNIARMAMNGDLKTAFEGLEPVYWFTPGMRYARAAEKIVFGDTNIGYAAFIACLPWIVYLLMNHLCGGQWARWGVILFLFLPVSFSFAQYIDIASLGYAEPVGSGLFLIGLLLFLKSQPRWGGMPDGWFALWGGVLLAGSMFVRPNFAIAVALLGLFFLYASCRARDFTLMACASAGLAFALLMPIHNLYFGHEFYLISKSGTTISIPLSPLTYLRAAYELITGNWNGTHLIAAGKQMRGWLLTLPELRHFSRTIAVLFMILKLPTLIVSAAPALRAGTENEPAFVLAWVALAAHLPMLFIFETYFRYGMLAWDLSALVTLVIIARYARWPSGQRFPQLVKDAASE
ncbi:MAG: hypothetical protein HY742_04685 [Deltaproteobacteria bacterium]|nr:hypothetical protein [Deltaproteobacteria bacterium]